MVGVWEGCCIVFFECDNLRKLYNRFTFSFKVVFFYVFVFK